MGARVGDLVERSPITVECRRPPGEVLPALDDEVAVRRIEFESVPDTAGGLGSNDGRTASEERVVNDLSGTGVVQDRSPQALYRLLRTVTVSVIITTLDIPQGAL